VMESHSVEATRTTAGDVRIATDGKVLVFDDVLLLDLIEALSVLARQDEDNNGVGSLYSLYNPFGGVE